MDQEEKINRLEQCIAEHCHCLAQRSPDALRGYASHIVVAFENSILGLGKSEDQIRLEELARHLGRSIAVLAELSDATKQHLNYSSPPLPNEEQQKLFGQLLIGASPTANNALFDGREQALASLAQGVERELARQRGLDKIHPRTNYDAASVAAACRRIWREEQDGEEPPIALQHYREDQPIAQFVAAVFNVLDIAATPSAAFKRLVQLGGEEAFRLSVVVG